MSSDQTGLPVANEKHELLKPFEGEFRATVQIFMGEGEPMVSTGKMTNRFVLGGLYLEQEYDGDPSEGPFPVFCGKGFWGVHQGTGMYEGFWIDNASSIMQREDGDVDESGKVWEMTCDVDHPTAGRMRKRSIIRLIDDANHEVESYMSTDGGPEAKIMEIRYVRI